MDDYLRRTRFAPSRKPSWASMTYEPPARIACPRRRVLNHRERQHLQARHPLSVNQRHWKTSLIEVKVSRERVRQIRWRAFEKVRLLPKRSIRTARRVACKRNSHSLSCCRTPLAQSRFTQLMRAESNTVCNDFVGDSRNGAAR